jgi:hypothetical protein
MFTIDEYYNIPFYNEGLQAMRNNGVDYKEYISTKAPYNFYIESKEKPIMVNYDVLTNAMQKYIINKVEPATSSEEYLLSRRTQFEGIKGLKEYGMNKPMSMINKSDYACFFSVKNKTEMLELSESLGTLFYFGKYYNNIRVGLCYNKMIKNMIEPDRILVEKTKNAIQMELDINFRIFRLNDRLRKFTETPYFKDGKYKPVKIKQFNVEI